MTGTVRYCPDLSAAAALPHRDAPDASSWASRASGRSCRPRSGWARPPSPTSSAARWCSRRSTSRLQVCLLRHQGEPVPAELAAAHEQFAPVYAAIRAKLGFDQCRVGDHVDRSDAAGRGAVLRRDRPAPARGVGDERAHRSRQPLSPPTRCASAPAGRRFPASRLRIADDGELMVRGGNVMAGYYRAPEQTADTVDPDGWVRTGDIAQVDADGYYRIVDRKKELIITSSGKNIAPVQVEAQLKRHPLDRPGHRGRGRRNYLMALLVLDPEVAPLWAQGRGIQSSSLADLAESPRGHRGGPAGRGRGELAAVADRADQALRPARRRVDRPDRRAHAHPEAASQRGAAPLCRARSTACTPTPRRRGGRRAGAAVVDLCGCRRPRPRRPSRGPAELRAGSAG